MFISLEGIEGSGKTTQIDNIINYLKSRGRECLATREPGGTPIGQQIRAILLDPQNQSLDPWAEMLLYMADRVQHLHQTIRPNLKKGNIVVCDRYFDATLVYQGRGRGLDEKLIQTLHQLLCGNRMPDLTLLLDLDPEVGLKRAWQQVQQGSRGDDETRFENEALTFHRQIREGYLQLAQTYPQRFRIVDATRNQEQVWHQIRAHLDTALSDPHNLAAGDPNPSPRNPIVSSIT